MTPPLPRWRASMLTWWYPTAPIRELTLRLPERQVALMTLADKPPLPHVCFLFCHVCGYGERQEARFAAYPTVTLRLLTHLTCSEQRPHLIDVNYPTVNLGFCVETGMRALLDADGST